VIYRNGYPARTWDTRGGRLELEISRVRQWSFLAMLLEPRWRIELALGPAQRWGISVIRSGEFQMTLSSGRFQPEWVADLLRNPQHLEIGGYPKAVGGRRRANRIETPT